MGFSVSGSAAIVFVGVMVAAGIAVPSLVGSMGALADSQGEQVDRGIDALNTEFEITSATYDSNNTELTLELRNTGSTTLGVNETSVLVDGTIQRDADIQSTDVDGDSTAALWLPGQTLTIEIDYSGPNRVKVVAENGIAETVSDGIVVV
ncbi:fla cluster protein FlaF [Natronomonas moolapensis 8.8.11]|uniref:Fla cluster protein FlaF n=1 Tax=Natronomonas moolapensis (strain DSM 18674 / CECT 7526 / JCM 14361 / 8.8.11) TaxID=268739 RepID=M1Y489_NATM8|nr:fla cluster protein FlaF [Natronomonas moolapensis 8.8.11]